MEAAQTIREAVARVAALRIKAQSTPSLQAATLAVKEFQARRFAATYADLLVSREYGAATQFFLEELYSAKDYSQRDAQFARIAGALQTFFPQAVVATAVSLAELHVMTEELDHAMAEVWSVTPPLAHEDCIHTYLEAWNAVGTPHDRDRQLRVVLQVGQELERLTRTTGLRMMLKMMRRPAHAAGLGSLQGFLESGFDTFAGMSGKGTRAHEFLAVIQERESDWIGQFFVANRESSFRRLHEALAALPTADRLNAIPVSGATQPIEQSSRNAA